MAKEITGWESDDGDIYQTEDEALEADYKYAKERVHRLLHIKNHLDARTVLDAIEANPKTVEQYVSHIIRRSEPCVGST